MATWKTIMARPAEYSPARASSREKSGREDRRGHRGSSRPPVVLWLVMALLAQFRARHPFPLDAFQLEAIRAIEAGQSVIVSAPTGAGKTLVAEFAIHMALATGKRIAYTTPLKALSNQKFNDFTRAFGAETVGILTGDVKVNPHGRVLVMTTEILRNALYGSGLDDLGYIVLDECHYMGDEARGTVWEEIIVNAPGGGPWRPDRRARDARLAPRDLLHLQPRRLRARDGRRPRRGQEPPHHRAAVRRGPRDQRAHPRQPDGRRVSAEPDGVPGTQARRGPPPCRDPAEPQAAHRAALRTRALQSRLRHRDDVARDPHAGAQRRAPGPHQTHRPRLPVALAQRADPDGRARRPPRDRPRGQVRDRPGRARRRGGPPARRGRLARADREPVQARLRLRRAPPRHRRAARGPQAADRVVVRPVPEPQAHPRAGGGGPDPRGSPRGDQALRGAARRLPAYRTLPARAPGGGGAAPGPRPRRASGRTERRGSRDPPAGPRPAQGRAGPRADPRRPLDPRPSCAHRRAPAPRRRRPREERGRQADLLGHAAFLRAARPGTRRPRAARSRRRARAAVRPGAPGTRAGAGARGRALVDRVPPVPLGRPAEVRSRVARARDAHGAPRRPAARARAIQERVLAGVPHRGRGARAVRRRARPPTRAAG